MKKIKSEGSQLFNVPNDEQGKAWLKQMHQYRNANSPVSLHSRGRGSRKSYAQNVGKYTANSSLPIHRAEWVAVYLDTSNKFQARMDRLWTEKQQALIRIKELEETISASTINSDLINSDLEAENFILNQIIEQNKTLLHDAYCKRIMNAIHGRDVADLFTILKTITQ